MAELYPILEDAIARELKRRQRDLVGHPFPSRGEELEEYLERWARILNGVIAPMLAVREPPFRLGSAASFRARGYTLESEGVPVPDEATLLADHVEARINKRTLLEERALAWELVLVNDRWEVPGAAR